MKGKCAMKNKFFIVASLTITGIFIFNTTINAQNSKMSVQTNSSPRYIALNTASNRSLNESSVKRSSEDTNFESEKVKLNSKSVYLVSEQFVFDNLNSLKTSFTISDIYFDLDDATIRPDALTALNSLVTLLKENPGVNVAVTAFSDSRMAKYNDKLANSRAQAAKNHLISRGITADRIVFEKHGRPDMTNPCNNNPNCSLAEQQINRRTEFNIVYNGVNLGQIN